jgi:hypothetical protein
MFSRIVKQRQVWLDGKTTKAGVLVLEWNGQKPE